MFEVGTLRFRARSMGVVHQKLQTDKPYNIFLTYMQNLNFEQTGISEQNHRVNFKFFYE